jgi:transposase-like protein
MMQTALEAEVDEFLGRARYQRRTDQGRPGSRNGWQPPAAVKTTMGPVELQRPKLRGTDEAFCSRLFGAGVTRTNALESLVISGWVRGLSDRDIQAALAEVLGAEAALSKSTVSRICQRIRDEFQAWRHRDLGAVRLDYLFLDGSHFKMHAGAPAEPVLAAWGIDVDGRPVLVGLAPAASESTDAWDDFLADLTQRGLRAPLLGSATALPGSPAPSTGHSPTACASGVSSTEPATPWPRCPPMPRPRRRPTSGPSSTSATPSPATRPSPSPTARRPSSRRREEPLPSAVACVTDDLASLTVHLRFPAEHWRRVRHSNFIERTFGETRRRVKVIGRLPGESSCLSLVWAVLDRASRGWRGLTMTPRALRLLQDLRHQLLHPPADKEVIHQAVTAAA